MTLQAVPGHISDPPGEHVTWAEYTWPQWVPISVRVGVEHNAPAGPRAWIARARALGAPELGSILAITGVDGASRVGRYVHYGMDHYGRLIHLDGTGLSLLYLLGNGPAAIPAPPRTGRWIR
jgi:hypothetical protein